MLNKKMDLDNQKNYQKYDTGQVADSMELLSKQIENVILDSQTFEIPASYKKSKQIIVAGMGGSNLGAGIIKSIFLESLKIPLNISAGYQVPANVDQDTLYIISSYSGGTEEPLSTYEKAKKKKAKIIILSAEGEKNKLIDLMKKENVPGLIFSSQANPSGQPRLGLGSAVFALMILLSKAGFLELTKVQTKRVVDFLEQNNELLKTSSSLKMNQAKKIALSVFGKQVVLVGAEHVLGNVRALRNQICESSKNFSSYLNLPDLNHFAMEGLAYPKSNQKNLIFVFFNSDLYDSRVQLRSKLTQEVIKKNKISVFDYKLKAEDKMTQAFELLQLGSWLSYYLGILNKVDPVKIPWVDWFKEQLGDCRGIPDLAKK